MRGSEPAEIITVEQRIKAIRANYPEMKIKLGEHEWPVRLLTVDETRKIISDAKLSAFKAPAHVDKRQFESIEVLKKTIAEASTVDGTPYMSIEVVSKFSAQELEEAYRQYEALTSFINPDFEALSDQEFNELVDSVKKKDRKLSALSISELAGIGRYYLEKS